MARLITNKMRAMLNYRPGNICPIDGEPMWGSHAGYEDLARVNGTWQVVHRGHGGIFSLDPRPQPDPRIVPYPFN